MTRQPLTKKALRDAVRSGRHVLLVGGTAEERLAVAKQIVALMPPLDAKEAEELRENHRAIGLNSGAAIELTLRTPHETISIAGLCGSPTLPTPGEAALAHTGVLFLADAPKFRKSALGTLAAVLEAGCSPAKGKNGPVLLPVRCTLVAGQDAPGGVEAGPLGSLLRTGKTVCFVLVAAVPRNVRRVVSGFAFM